LFVSHLLTANGAAPRFPESFRGQQIMIPSPVRQALCKPEPTVRYGRDSVSRHLATFFVRPATHLRKSAVQPSATQPSATQGTAAGSPVGADGGQDALWCDRQKEEFIHDAHDQSHAVGDGEFVVEAIKMRVDGVRRDADVGGDGAVGAVVEHAAHDLQFARG